MEARRRSCDLMVISGLGPRNAKDPTVLKHDSNRKDRELLRHSVFATPPKLQCFGPFLERNNSVKTQYPKGPNLEKFQDRLKFSISLENFNLAWNFQSWPPEFPTQNRGFGGWLAWKSEVNKRGRPSKWPPECLPSKFPDFECAFYQ